MNNKNTFWYIIILIFGIVCLAVSVWLARSYIFAEIKLDTEALLVNVDEVKRFEKDSYGKQNPYYDYTLTWEYSDKDRGVTRQYTTHEKNMSSGVYSEGKTKTITIYSNDGENYYIHSWGTCVIVGGLGMFFIVVGIMDYVCVTKRKKEQENWQNVIKQRVKEAQENKNNEQK